MERPITLDDLIAVSDEIAALVRAGVPLERSLASVASEWPGRLGGVLEGLAERLARGESLTQSFRAQPGLFPPAYAAVVEAGMKAGRLSSALESLTAVARNLAELRRTIASAMIYPLFVLVVAYSLFVAVVVGLVPRLQAAFESFRFPTDLGLSVLVRLHETAVYWVAVPPMLLLAGASVRMWRGDAGALGGGLFLAFWWLPRARKMIGSARRAGFSEILVLLVEHGVGLSESLRLAGASMGDRSMADAAGRLADAVEQGANVVEVARSCPTLPPFLGWALGTGGQRNLATVLRQSAKIYHDRTRWHAELLRLVLPTTLLLAIGGSGTVLYTLTVFVPFTRLLQQLGLP